MSNIQSRPLEYADGAVTLQGFLAYPAGASHNAGVLVVHEWWGLNDFIRDKARQVAELGYTVLAVDMYGDGTTAADSAQASAMMTPWVQDRHANRRRITAGFEALRKQPEVDPNRIACMGFCFGGLTSLELARSGADIRGAISLHGALSNPHPADTKNIRAKVLILHGADDGFIPASDLATMEREMTDAGVDWQLIKFGGCVHSFTNPLHTDKPKSGGLRYDATADRRAFTATREFLAEVLS